MQNYKGERAIKGIVLKKKSNAFNVLLHDGSVQTCFARKNVKQLGNLQAGDKVQLQQAGANWVIATMQERKNQLIRPYISNVDQLVIVLSHKPSPDFMLVDKLIMGCDILEITPIIVVNKSDILPSGFFSEVLSEYSHAVNNILLTNTTQNHGLDQLLPLLENKLSAFAGQSGVGKSSIINSLSPQLQLKTDALSKKLAVGKNTTRETQIFVINKTTLIADTPGFNMLHHHDLHPSELKHYYAEFEKYSKNCAYADCNHTKESAEICGVIRAVDSGEINAARYGRYKELFNKMQTSWRDKYD